MSGPYRRRLRQAAALAAAAVIAVPSVTACGSDTSAGDEGDGKLRVVATTTQVADFARNIGGDHVHVTQLLKPNVDPHDFEPAPADIQAVSEADVLVENGVDLESWLDDMVKAAGFDGTTVDSSKGVELREAGEAEGEHAEGEGEHAEEQGHEHGDHDPHIWQSPANAKIMVRNIEQAFAKADPDHEKAYGKNLASYDEKLDELNADIKRQIATIPKDQRKVVTNHDAFGYYLDQYGLTFVGSIIPSLDTSAELSGRQLDELVTKIKAEKVPAVFSESSLPPKTAEAIGSRAGVEVVAGEDSLYGDTLGPEGSEGATYIAMMEHNTETIVGGLRG